MSTKNGSQRPNRLNLAYLPVGTDGYVGYWAAMTFALRFAEVNRSRILDVVEAAFGAHTRVGRFERVVDVHHNYAA
jgi:RNA-splicing ligase RtcB